MSVNIRALDVRFPLAAGALLAVLTLVIRTFVFPYTVLGTLDYLFLAWMLLGAFLLATIPIWAYYRYSTVSPVLLSGGAYAAAFILTLQRYQELSGSGAAASASPTVYSLFLLGWFLPLGIAIAAGGLEYVLRR